MWVRVRFQANPDDYRPITFPPPGPFWCSGYGDDYSIVIAYLPKENWETRLKEFWPEADEISSVQEKNVIEFSSRFPKPEWWEGEAVPMPHETSKVFIEYLANQVGRIELTNDQKIELHTNEIRNLLNACWDAAFESGVKSRV